MEFKFCPHCGNKLKKVPVLTEGAWELRKNCATCGLRVLVTYGDPQGGSSDQYYFSFAPEKEDTKCPVAKPVGSGSVKKTTAAVAKTRPSYSQGKSSPTGISL